MICIYLIYLFISTKKFNYRIYLMKTYLIIENLLNSNYKNGI